MPLPFLLVTSLPAFASAFAFLVPSSWFLRLASSRDLPQAPTVPPVLPPRISHLAESWRARVAPSQRRALAFGLVVLTLAAAHVARAGTTTARAIAACMIALAVFAWIANAVRDLLARRHPERSAVRVIHRIDRDLAERTGRAIHLVRRTRHEGDPVSAALAMMHLDSLAAKVGLDRLEESAARVQRRWGILAFGFVFAAVAAIVWGPLRVFEGLDVLVSRHGRAPLSIEWLDEVEGEVQVPRYLRQDNGSFVGLGRTLQPRGSVVVLRATPVHRERKLVLTDGTKEVPFVDDAHGAVVARWVLGDSAELQIAARFGNVLITQSSSLDLVSIPDTAPQVTVDDAPKTVRLLDVADIAVAWEAQDDHGLTEIDLVLRSGEREDRRVLARFDGQSQLERGSSVVHAGDRFLKQAWAPVQIFVEARDNDPITGPKWGRSAAVTVIPPAVGEAEARRYLALRGVLDASVDLLARRIEAEVPSDAKAAADHGSEEQQEQRKLAEAFGNAMNDTFGGLRVPRALNAAVAGNLELLNTAVEAERKAKGAQLAKEHDRTREATEKVVLTFDTALRLVASADAAKGARKLADAADEAAAGARQARGADRARGMARVNGSIEVLASSSEWIGKLDRLGKDLGEVIGIGARRIQRSVEAGDLHQAELAAIDLGMRLRKPLPSFSGGGGRRSTESGGAGEEAGEDSGEQPGMAEMREEISRIAREHGDAMQQLEQELAKALQSGSVEQLRKQARDHAQVVRDSVRGLPPSAVDATSAESTAAAAREMAMSMADALENGNLPEAVSRGHSSLRAAEQAKRMAGQQRDFFGDMTELGARLDRAKGNLEREVRWAEQQLENVRRATADQARDALDKSSATEENLAKRTGEASKKGRGSEVPLPRNMRELLDGAEKAMRDSSRALKGNDVDKGTEHQREAQRMLEMARELQGDPSKEDGQERAESDDDSDGGKDVGGRVDIPKAEDFRGPEAFRKRVLEGLGASRDPRLRDAVKRYAEGLLR